MAKTPLGVIFPIFFANRMVIIDVTCPDVPLEYIIGSLVQYTMWTNLSFSQNNNTRKDN